MIRMSFSSKHTYDTCPALFEFKYIKKEYAFEDFRHTFLGNVMDVYFDWFYKHKLYEVDWLRRLSADIDSAISFHTEKIAVEDYAEFIRETKEKCLDLIPRSVAGLKKFGFVADRVYTQYDLEYVYDHPKRAFPIHFLGKADFVFLHNKNDVRIFDGKASKYRHRNVHPEQLKLYAFLFFLKHHIVPVQLGFIYWSFPDRSVDHIYLEKEDFHSLLDSCYTVAERIIDKDYVATPSGHCYICPYSSKCKSGQEFRKKSKKTLNILENDFMLEDFNGS